jgi:GntR family transcriptional regulator, carbon starvation induced regulator
MDAITDTAAMGVADAAYSRLRSDILGGELLPGMKLKLDALRDRYEVSVNTLRETLSRLAASRLSRQHSRT